MNNSRCIERLAAFALAACLAALCPAKAASVNIAEVLDDENSGWGCSNLATTVHGEYYFNSNGGAITSPVLPFAVTSVVAEVRATSVGETSRKLAVSGGGVTRVLATGEADKKEFVTAGWDASDGVRSLRFHVAPGATVGNIYLYSVELCGVALIEAPTGLDTTSVRATEFTLRWENHVNTFSNRIDVSRVVWHDAEGDRVDFCDFGLVTNTAATAVLCLEEDGSLRGYADFCGANVYAAGTNDFGSTPSVGLVQISSGKRRGALAYSGPGVDPQATLLVMAKKHPTDVSHGVWAMEVCWTDGETTNSVAEVSIGADYPARPFAVPLDGVEEGATLVLRPSGTADGNRRILLDSLEFVSGYSPAHEEAWVDRTIYHIVAGGPHTLRIRGLERYVRYRATVTAFDRAGAASDPAGPVEFTTDGHDLGLSVILR